MRGVSCVLVLVWLCLTGTGCSLFQKNTNGSSASAGGGPPPPKFPGSAQDPLLPPLPAPPAAQTAAVKGESMLAGTVTDAYHRPISNAYIRWVSVDEKDAGAPIDVSTDSGGHFVIMGVKQGGSYKLIARTKQGEKMMAGTVYTSAPNVRVYIPVQESQVNGDTPPLPGTPAYSAPAPKDGAANSPGAGWNTGDTAKKTAETPNLPAMVVPVAPSTAQGPEPASAAKNSTIVPGVVENANPSRLPMLTIPSPPLPKVPLMPNDPPRPPALMPSDARLDTGPTRVPSCVLVGTRLENLALKDSKGQTWEYKQQGYGKIVLIDFWGTYCAPCRDTMPALNRLHQKYAARGLEVVGIALEPGKDEQRERDAVNKACASMQITYRQLMGRVASYDAAKDFRIERMPTLMLLNAQGVITWRYVGGPDAKLLESLERTIEASLPTRAF